MLLVSLLVASALISLSKSTPYRRREPDEILLDIPYIKGGSWDPAEYYGYSLQNEQTEVPKTDNNGDGTTARRKKMGSLSITNPMDVLRQRFLLELQRRRQMQQQEQAKANREILNDIGKRSARRLGMIYPRIQTRNNQAYQPAGASTGHVASDNPLWSRLERFDWYNVGNSGEHVNDAEQSNKMETNELHLL